MKRNMKTMLLVLALMLMIIPAASAVAAAPSSTTKPVSVKSVGYELIFDGKTLVLPNGQYLFIQNGVSYVPIRFVSYALQKTVAWDSKTATVKVSDPTAKELTALKEYLTNATASSGTAAAKGNVALSIKAVAASFVFNGKTVKLPANQSAFMLNNSLYVPVRFMSESTGSVIGWDSKTHRISGQSEAYRNEQSNSSGSSNENTGSNEGTGTGTSQQGGTPGGAPGSGAGTATVSLQSIKDEADSKINSLYETAKTKLMGLAVEYLLTDDKAQKDALYNQGQAYVTQVTSQFNTILAETRAKLVANGYSAEADAIIAAYQARFDAEIKSGMEQANSMKK